MSRRPRRGRTPPSLKAFIEAVSPGQVVPMYASVSGLRDAILIPPVASGGGPRTATAAGLRQRPRLEVSSNAQCVWLLILFLVFGL